VSITTNWKTYNGLHQADQGESMLFQEQDFIQDEFKAKV
jgi:hypothetical protein